MVFKLVRTDTVEPCKISLPIGAHLLGRGKLLDCEDKRVSRNHGELTVTDDAITIKALHQNPCFFKKKGIHDIQILRKDCTIGLGNGDQFGLLIDCYWFEVLFCPNLEDERLQSDKLVSSNQQIDIGMAEDNGTAINTVKKNGTTINIVHQNDTTINTVQQNGTAISAVAETEVIDAMLNKTVEDDENISSPSLLQGSNNLDTIRENDCAESNSANTITDPVPSTEPTVKTEVLTPTKTSPVASSTEDRTPVKRERGTDGTEDLGDHVKRVKTESEDSDVTPGTSSDTQGQPNKDKQAPAMPPSPQKPPNPPVRERCMYGASCFRRNPQHKAQFSHPTDPDWGSGPRGLCPYGAACNKRDPRHWRDHEHPPWTVPPADRPGVQVVQRRGNTFYIHAHTVNFYDDHFNVEGSDGDSVDYDYEF